MCTGMSSPGISVFGRQLPDQQPTVWGSAKCSKQFNRTLGQLRVRVHWNGVTDIGKIKFNCYLNLILLINVHVGINQNFNFQLNIKICYKELRQSLLTIFLIDIFKNSLKEEKNNSLWNEWMLTECFDLFLLIGIFVCCLWQHLWFNRGTLH